MQIEVADAENGADQDDADDDHQDVGVTGRGDETWQMMRRSWMKGFAQANLPARKLAFDQASGIGRLPGPGSIVAQ